MSKFNLGNINIYDQKIPSYPFLIADVVDNGGMEDPVEVADINTLYNYFRYADHYKDYVKLINAGATLVLLGNRKKFDDLATFTFFNQGNSNLAGKVKYTTVNPEYLDMEDDDFISEVLSSSRSFTEFSDESSKLPLQNVVYSEDKHKTYRLHYRLKDEYIEGTDYDLYNAFMAFIASQAGDKYPARLIIPAPESTRMTRDLCLTIGTQTIYNTDEETRERMLQDGFDDYTRKPGLSSNILIRMQISEQITDSEFLHRLFYPTIADPEVDQLWETFWPDGPRDFVWFDEDYKGFTIDTPFLADFENFCDKWCPLFDVTNDEEFTQMLYHAKGLLTQGVLLSGKARIPNREGHDIVVNYIASENYQTFTASLFEQSETFVVQNPLRELTESQFIEIVRYNHNLQDTIAFEGECKLSNFIESTHDNESLYNAYESIKEYEVPVTCMIAPRHIQEWIKCRTAKGSLKELFREYARTYPTGGRQNTLLIQLEDESEVCYEDTLSIENAFYFSGSYDGSENVYAYLIKLLIDKEFSFEKNSDVESPDEDSNLYARTLKVVYDDYQCKFDDAQELVVSLGISQLINLIYYSLSPGTPQNLITSRLNGSISAVQSLNRLIRRVSIENIVQKQNTLEITLVIYYRLYDKEVTVNFNLYKSYGRSSDTP